MYHERRVSLGQMKVLGEQGQLGRGPARRDQVNPKDCYPYLGQGRAGQGRACLGPWGSHSLSPGGSGV